MIHARLTRPTDYRKPRRYAALYLHERLPVFARTSQGLGVLRRHPQQHYDLLRHLGLLSAAVSNAHSPESKVNLRLSKPAFGWRSEIEKARNPDPGPDAKVAKGKAAGFFRVAGRAVLAFIAPSPPGTVSGAAFGYPKRKPEEEYNFG